MTFNHILGQLKESYPLNILKSHITIDEEISEIHIFDRQGYFQENKFYIGNADEISSWIKDESILSRKKFALSVIIGVKEGQEKDDGFQELLASSILNGMISNYALIKEENILKVLQALNNVIQKELQTSHHITELMALTMKGADLKSLLLASEKTLNNSVIVIDASFKILSTSSKDNIKDDIWIKNIQRGYCSYKFITEVSKLIKKGPFPNTSQVFEVNCDFSINTKLCSKIFHKNRLIGYVVMLNKNTSNQHLVEKFLPMLSRSVCDVLLRTKEYKGIFGSQVENLLYELIYGADEELIHLRLKINHMEFPSKMGCLVIKMNKYLHNIQATAYLKDQISSVLPGAFGLVEQENLIFICKLQQDGRLTLQENKKLLTFFQQGVLNMCMSSPCEDIMSLKDAYHQCLQLSKISKKLQVGQRIMYFSDYSFYVLLSNLKEKDLLQYSHPALRIICQYDQKQNSELYKTLEAFIDHQLQMSKTAEVLSIHRNSLSYRINKIINLTGLDFSNNDEIFKLSYGFKVDKYCRVPSNNY